MGGMTNGKVPVESVMLAYWTHVASWALVCLPCSLDLVLEGIYQMACRPGIVRDWPVNVKQSLLLTTGKLENTALE